MFLATTSAKYEILLGASTTTNALPFVATWFDNTTSALTPGLTANTVNSSTPVTLVDSPASSTQRQVKTITVYNEDTVDATVTIRYNDGSSTFKIITITVPKKETLQYVYDSGWKVTDKFGGERKGNAPSIFPEQGLYLPEYYINSNSVNKQLTNSTSSACYLRKATRAYTSVDCVYQVNTAGVGITWAEIAIGVGTQTIQHNAQIIARSFADVSGVVNSTGIKKTTITLTNIKPGDDLYFIYAAQVATTSPTFAGQAAETLSSGFNYSVGTTHRPSLDLDRVVEFAVNTSTTANVACVFS